MDLILFHDRLYVAKDLLKSKRKVLKNLKQGKLQPGVYVITLPLGDEDMLDIYPSYVLLQKAFKNFNVTVVGIAGEQETAFELIETMMNDCIAIDNTVNIRAYFENSN